MDDCRHCVKTNESPLYARTARVRNKIDLSADPGLVFLNPWREEGLKLLASPEFVWRETQSGVIDGFAVSAHAEINSKIRACVTETNKQKRFQTTLEINTVPVVLDDVSFRKSHVMAGGKLVLSGASATRLFNQFGWDRSRLNQNPTDALNDYLLRCRKDNSNIDIDVESTFLESDLDFAVECRNTFNYFHFITESLCQLSVLDGLGFRGNIFFHFPNQEDKQGDFAEAFVAVLFPEYAGRVFFERAPKDYDLVLSSFDMHGGVAQMPEGNLAALRKFVPQGAEVGKVEFQPLLAMNSFSTALLSLRVRALRAIESRDFSKLPKRIFVGRSETQSRSRPLAGQDELLKELGPLGFEYVVFEELEPLEQIALMANAEVMISQHGAGFTNMMFANPNAYVIELGTLQTAQHRWPYFWPIAHVSRCKYLNFFADFDRENPLEEPEFSKEGIVPVALSVAAISQITAFVSGILGVVPKVATAKNLQLLARRVLRAGAVDKAILLLDAYDGLVSTNGDLCLLRADCHKALDEPKSELVALQQAHVADPKRWQTLVRIIWCANRCGRPEVLRWALTHLEGDFPDRHDAFVSNHEWVRFVA